MIAVTTQHDDRRPSPAEQDTNERAYHRAMARLTAERGYLNLSQAHTLAAQDCPRWCGCKGCTSTRAEATEQRAAKAKRVALARRVEA